MFLYKLYMPFSIMWKEGCIALSNATLVHSAHTYLVPIRYRTRHWPPCGCNTKTDSIVTFSLQLMREIKCRNIPPYVWIALLSSLIAFQYFIPINSHHTLWDNFPPKENEHPINHLAGKLQRDGSLCWSLFRSQCRLPPGSSRPLCRDTEDSLTLSNPCMPSPLSPGVATLWAYNSPTPNCYTPSSSPTMKRTQMSEVRISCHPPWFSKAFLTLLIGEWFHFSITKCQEHNSAVRYYLYHTKGHLE